MFEHIIKSILEDEKEEFIKLGGSESEWREAVGNGEFKAEVIDTRHDTTTNIIEPKIRLTNLGGTWETWCNDGESAKDYKWQEA